MRSTIREYGSVIVIYKRGLHGIRSEIECLNYIPYIVGNFRGENVRVSVQNENSTEKTYHPHTINGFC